MTRILGVILAGGRATRMGGRDKGLLLLGDATLVDHVHKRLAPQCDEVAISANGDPARFSQLGLPVLADTIPDYPGPLAGVLAGLEWAAQKGADVVVTAAADTPFLPSDLVVGLRQAAAREKAAIALAASPDETGALRLHPTFGLWPVDLRMELHTELCRGLRKILLWVERHGAATASFPAEPFDPFFNVNTPQDMVLAQEIRQGGARRDY
ncbi:molybdenum cofactor guanylyltransferase MobA [Pseudorhizobium flavum]|uniref:Molybdenum cofactor guanylyltransferase n=1 Tax=Pseudorhizobium flavum TaxID=1335061 RepID=A0A7X0DE63_9HYPH|nr:molybdenum cofactor guanylyltransferase MobA [Pseudorhizobium flavum]MBB6181607.1 molybdopterin-guanine dinucleotide biosynthesis protein A [Pseudorhizobium flavum]CAD6619606.1 molybdopterin-guanine dinucleotide biosynthesis protein MobA [Pseudorhizobium flavum]